GPKGILARKTRILVTHGLTYTKDADDIIVFQDGAIVESGTFDCLVKKGGTFTKSLISLG
ncbi:hypothetical protein PFISCL1PPCAC_14269, partial [Pristionchus fissidentatus]